MRRRHARPDEAAVHRLVPAAAAGEDGDLALHRGVGAQDHVWIDLHAETVRVGGCDPLEGLLHDLLGIVDQLLHASVTLKAIAPRMPPTIGPTTGIHE